MSQALFALYKEKQNTTMAMSAYIRVKTALDLSPNDTAIKTFYEEVKVKYEEIMAAEKKKKEEAQKSQADGPKDEPKKETTKDKLLSRVKIDEDEKLPPLGQTLPEDSAKEKPKV